MPDAKGAVLFDGEIAGVAVPTQSFVDTTIGPTADEPHDPVPIGNTDLALVDNGRHAS